MKITTRHVKFGLVGLVNTATDVGIYTLLIAGGLAPLWANGISTSCGMAVSYVLNQRYTFQAHDRGHREMILKFLLITIIGLWVVQPVIIYTVRNLGSSLVAVADTNLILNLAAKLIATGVSLIWNYCFYSRFVFTATKQRNMSKE